MTRVKTAKDKAISNMDNSQISGNVDIEKMTLLDRY